MGKIYNFPDMKFYGCVIFDDDITHLFILDGNQLLTGIPIEDDSVYTTLDSNELIMVGVNVKDEEGSSIDAKYIDDDNYDQLEYVVTPLKFHTLKTDGLTVSDLYEMELLDLLVKNMVDDFLRID